jgi:hypothetical protein
MRRIATLTAAVFVSLAGSALASPVKQYVLHRPKREHCRAHYVKQVEHGKTRCVRPTPTAVFIPSTIGAGPGQLQLQAFLFTGTRGHEGAELRLPVHFTITDVTTGKSLASFTGTSFKICTLAASEQNTVRTVSAEAFAPYPACALPAPVSLPTADEYSFVGSFAGNSTYAPSSEIP